MCLCTLFVQVREEDKVNKSNNLSRRMWGFVYYLMALLASLMMVVLTVSDGLGWAGPAASCSS